MKLAAKHLPIKAATNNHRRGQPFHNAAPVSNEVSQLASQPFAAGILNINSEKIMNTLLKIAATVAIFATTVSAYSAVDIAANMGEENNVFSSAVDIMQSGYNGEKDIALVSQKGTDNIAYIGQLNNGNNFAAIVQDTTVAAAAYIFQAGNGNRAMIYQK